MEMASTPTSILDAVVERHRPATTRRNSTVARNGHDCKLPVWVGYPVSLDPRTGGRAEAGLVVQCEDCDALWRVVKIRGIVRNGPDLIWSQLRPFTSRGRRRLAKGAVPFNATTAYAKPDPKTIDWSAGGPRRANGMKWWQMDFEEMLGHGVDRCVSTTRSGHGPIGGPMTYTDHTCVLKVAHAGLHESPDSACGAIGW